MSVQHTAYAVIGYEIPRENFVTRTKRDKCKCGTKITDTHKFCSECGLRVNKTVLDQSTLDHIIDDGQFKSFKVGFSTDHNHVYIGIVAKCPSSTSNLTKLNTDDITFLKGNLDDAIPEIIRKNCKFGLHAVLHVSY